MMSTLLLSADSIFAGAALRFFGTSRRNLGLACGAVGLADGIALLLGRALHNVVAAGMSVSDPRVLLAGCALASIVVGKANAGRPRAAVLGIAILFSIDNLLAGAQMSSLGSTAFIGCGAGVISGLCCFGGFDCAHALASHVRPRVAFALASVVVIISFLIF